MSELVPELHDLLKLTRLRHDIDKWNSQDLKVFKPFSPKEENETWQGVKQHHWFRKEYPRKPDTFYLHMADWLASAFSRPSEEAEGIRHPILHKLWWRPLESEAEDVRLQNDSEIISLFEFCSATPSWEEFLKNKKYKHILKNRVEDEAPGKNITSLYTHCKLTGQFYRILKSSSQFAISQSELDSKTSEQVRSLDIEKRTEKWQLMVVKCKLHFLQKPYRARDLNIFGGLEDLMKEISTCYPDNVFFNTSNEVCLVLPDEEQLSDIASRAQGKGFWVEVSRNQQCLGKLHPNPESMAEETLEYKNFYTLPERITPPICEICQGAKATKHWPEDYVLSYRELCPQCKELLSENSLSSVADFLCEIDKAKLEDLLQEPAREDLCEVCFSLRAKETKLPRLERWSREEQTKVAWLKLSLDFDQLNDTLKELYLKRFIASFPAEKAEIRFSVIGEFQEDYASFLQEFKRQILYGFKAENVETILEDFFCVRIGRLGETLRLLQIYHKLLIDFFPAFLNLKSSPLKISIVCANSKFPFFEVWRMIEKPQEDIFVSLTGRGIMRAPIRALDSIVEAANIPYRKSALHKLAKIEETSRTLAELTFQDRRDKDYFVYSRLGANLRSSLDFPSILTFAKLVGD